MRDGTGPLWLSLLLGLVGLAVGVLLANRLAAGSYRLTEAQERERAGHRDDDHRDDDHRDDDHRDDDHRDDDEPPRESRERDKPAPGHRWWVVPVTALLWLTLGWRFGADTSWSYLPAALFFAVVAVVLTSIDLDVHRLPDKVVLPSYPVLLVLLAFASAVSGHWGALLRAVIAAAVVWVVYLLLALLASFVSPGGFGYGDVKLGGALGLLLGWLGWDSVLVGNLAAFLLSGVVALVLLLLRLATRRSAVAFGPYMVLGAWVALLLSRPIS